MQESEYATLYTSATAPVIYFAHIFPNGKITKSGIQEGQLPHYLLPAAVLNRDRCGGGSSPYWRILYSSAL